MRDFLLFRHMVTPKLVQIIFWLAMVWLVYAVITNLIAHHIAIAIQVLLVGPIVFRLVAELLLVLFRIYENLVDINEKLNR